MSKRNAISELDNFKTAEMYKRQFTSLAENVFNFKNLDKIAPFMDYSYVNHELVYKGCIAFFWDEYLGLLALPYQNMGKLDLYGRPIDIQVIGRNGYHRFLKKDEYVIMWDNRSKLPLIWDILQYASRTAQIQRSIDINVAQMRTPRLWKTKTENEKTIKDLIDGVSANNEVITTYDNLEIDDTTIVLQPAPFVSDKLSEQKDKIWNEFLRLIGVANTSFQKKERNIRDEIFISQSGTIASRFTRFNARCDAINKINDKWSSLYPLDEETGETLKLEVEYFDGLPTTMKDEEVYYGERDFQDEEYNTDESDISQSNNES